MPFSAFFTKNTIHANIFPHFRKNARLEKGSLPVSRLETAIYLIKEIVDFDLQIGGNAAVGRNVVRIRQRFHDFRGSGHIISRHIEIKLVRRVVDAMVEEQPRTAVFAEEQHAGHAASRERELICIGIASMIFIIIDIILIQCLPDQITQGGLTVHDERRPSHR